MKATPIAAFFAIAFCTQTVSVGMAATIASPRDIALEHEAETANGAGVLLPDPELNVVLGPFSVEIDTDGAEWPREFLDALQNTGFDAEAGGWRISTSVDQNTGAIVFFDAEGRSFWSELPLHAVSSNWIAPFRRASPEPSESDALFDPGRIRMDWILGREEDFDRASGLPDTGLDLENGGNRSRYGENSVPRSLPPEEQTNTLRWTFFAPVSNRYDFVAEWPATNLAEYGSIDVLFKHRLEDEHWRWILRKITPDPAVLSNAFSIYESELPVVLPPFAQDPVQTNVVLSPFGVFYTNVIYAASSNEARQASGFFLAASIRDSDSDGLTDAVETHCLGTDPFLADTDGDTMPDAWETVFGFDPTDPGDAVTDADTDGIPNVYKYHNGTDPRIPDFSSAPRIVAGGTGTNAISTLGGAFALSMPYGIIEIAPGVHSGPGWDGLWLPDHPVLVTTGDGGRSRASRLIHRGSGLAAFYLDEEQNSHTVFQGLSVELAGSSGFQTAFWLGDGSPFHGPGSAACFKNVHVVLGASGTTRIGWFCRHSTDCNVVLAGCSVDASECGAAVGVYAIDSPALFLENCSFFGFPSATGGQAYAILQESTAQNFGNAPQRIDIMLKNCLFDESFSNALVLAPLTNGVAYRTRMDTCIVPAPLEYPANESPGLVYAPIALSSHGHIPAGSPAINAGSQVTHSVFDFDGEPRDSTPDIGADEFSDGTSADPDGDGLSNADEAVVGTDPFHADTDGDGLSDFDETEDETDPLDPGNFMFSVFGTATFVSEVPTNTFLAVVSDADRRLAFESVPVCGTNSPFCFQNVVVTNSPALALALFADLDDDGTLDPFENAKFAPFSPTGRVTRTDPEFGIITSDGDGDGIPDTWEYSHGLSSTNSLDAWEDPDCDGLINLHEYWHDYDPFVADGSNTVLSVISRSVDSRLAGKNPETALAVYENYMANAATNGFVRNTNCWAHGIDFSCASPWNSGNQGNWCAGTLVSPRHVVLANHFLPGIGTILYFHSPTGAVYGSRLAARKRVGDTDITIGLLQTEIPDDIRPAKILPANSRSMIGSGLGVPVMTFDQEEKALVFEIRTMDGFYSGKTATNVIVHCSYPHSTMRSIFSEGLMTHDSGNPAFLVFGDEIVLLGGILNGGPGVVPSCSFYANEIQDSMDALDPSYELQKINFADFPGVVNGE